MAEAGGVAVFDVEGDALGGVVDAGGDVGVFGALLGRRGVALGGGVELVDRSGVLGGECGGARLGAFEKGGVGGDGADADEPAVEVEVAEGLALDAGGEAAGVAGVGGGGLEEVVGEVDALGGPALADAVGGAALGFGGDGADAVVAVGDEIGVTLADLLDAAGAGGADLAVAGRRVSGDRASRRTPALRLARDGPLRAVDPIVACCRALRGPLSYRRRTMTNATRSRDLDRGRARRRGVGA